MARVVLPYDKACATTNRFAATNKIIEECVDLTLCALSVLYDLAYTDDIESMMHVEATKWVSL